MDSVILGHCVASIESDLPPNMVLMIQIVGICKVEDCCLPPCSMLSEVNLFGTDIYISIAIFVGDVCCDIF